MPARTIHDSSVSPSLTIPVCCDRTALWKGARPDRKPLTERAKLRGNEEHHARHLWTPSHSTNTHRLFRSGTGYGRVCVYAAAASASGAPTFKRDGGRAAAGPDHGTYPWTRRCPARERVRQP